MWTRAAIGIVGLVLMSLMALSFMNSNYSTLHAPMGSQKGFTYEVVTDPAAQELGLSGRATIPSDYGMLFVFPAPGMPGFWMKDMLTSIDMIWINDGGIIVGIEPEVSPRTYPKAFHPPSPVRYVLETRAGEAERKGWKVGTKLTLPKSSQKQ